ncbi:MAG TPA: sigma 54-interacting transcriptional regulator [Kofleriaceae bacterium]
MNAHTVYRWELPDDSPHSRTPRGDVLDRLQRLADKTSETADNVPVAAALQHMLDGRWRESEDVFIRALRERADASEAPANSDTRALASIGLSLIELFYRADVRRAFTALSPALAHGAPELALTHATAALVHSHPDRELFDSGRVHAHARRAMELDKRNSVIVRAFLVMADANTALLVGNDDLLSHALARIDDIAGAALPEVPAMYLEKFRSLAATIAGHTQLALDRLDRLLANPRISVCPSVEARCCALRAVRMLDNLGDPEEALVYARRAREIVLQNRLAPSVCTALGMRAEAEALMRLGRLDDVGRVCAEADKYLDEMGFPVTVAFPAQVRYLLMIGATDRLAALAKRVMQLDLPSMRSACQLYGAWMAASAALAADDGPAAIQAFEHAAQHSLGFNFIERDLLVNYANAALTYGSPQLARQVLERALRASARRPAAWVTAALRRVEGTLLIEDGRIDEGRAMLEAATSTFEAAGDRLDATVARYAYAVLERALVATDIEHARSPQPEASAAAAVAEKNVASALSALRAIGLDRTLWAQRIDVRLREAVRNAKQRPTTPLRTSGSPAHPASIDAASSIEAVEGTLEVWLRRLSVAGASPTMVRRELIAVAEQITGVRAVLVEASAAHATPAVAWFDVDAGDGTRYRLGVTSAPSPRAAAALRAISVVAGLALELAAVRAGGRTAVATPETDTAMPGVVAASPVMRRLLSDVARLASSRATVVITGESGTGKEVIAQALHSASTRSAKPFVAFNCAAVPHDLFEGQLFGYKKGAFTGAANDQLGVVRAADGGTLFLDEIGELPLDIQPKLLRFLDSREVFPIGAQRPVIADVRVLAATNRDLAAEVARGKFREDLYYRLQVVPLHIAPLRSRKEDIVPLARHFARELSSSTVPAFAPDALAALVEHTWPGNVRELRNVIARAMAYEPAPEVLTRAALGL